MQTIKVGICDDYKYLCDTYRDIFNMEDNIDVIWTALSSNECIEKLKAEACDILLLDIQMETETEGITCVKKIKSQFPNVKIIMLTGYNAAEYIFESFANGASNYVLKDDADENIIKMINDVYNDSIVIKDEIAKKLIEKSGVMYEQNRFIAHYFNVMLRLTKTEFEILMEFSKGKSNREIASERCVEENTVRKTASNILAKFKQKSMKQLIQQLNEYDVFGMFDIK